MNTVFDRAELLRLLRDFHELTGLRAVVFDSYGIDILSYPQDLPSFCRLVRSKPQGTDACLRCDQNACAEARRRRAPVLYSCHAGLIEIITPLLAEDSIAGYLLLSHIVQGADEAAEWQAVQQRCAVYDLPPEALRQAYCALPRTPYRVLRAAANLLSIAAQSNYHPQLARLVPDSQPERLNRFLADHLAEPLPSDRLCRELSLSRTALYHLAQRVYGCSISEQIARLRTQRAIQLLTTTSLSSAAVGQQIGLPDPAYFCRFFHKRTGFTPGGYRRQFSEAEGADGPVSSLL